MSKVVGIIAEFNPLHNGHAKLIPKAKEIAGADYCVVIMSGNYVQRGEPALFHKDLRTKAALTAGADAVFELPIPFATGSAEYFAGAAISMLCKLGCVTDLVFGSEIGDVNLLRSISSLLNKETEEFKNALKEGLASGLNFPSARAKALSILPELTDQGGAADEVLSGSNNILGIEYLRAIEKNGNIITPHTILRKGSYHAYGTGELSSEDPSAESLRALLVMNAKGSALSAAVRDSIPAELADLYETAVKSGQFITSDHFSPLLLQALNYETTESLTAYRDLTGDLANRILDLADRHVVFSDLISSCKTKNLTYTRISRALLSLILHITKEETEERKSRGYADCAYLLGFRKQSGELLTLIKKESSIPVVTNVGDAARSLNDIQLPDFHRDLRRDALYEKLTAGIHRKDPEKTVYERQIVILP